MRRRAVIEQAIGETRAAIYEGRRLVELRLRRLAQSVPNPGDIYTGRVITVDPSVAGAFIEIGTDKAGLLKFSAQKDLPKLTDGLYLNVEVTKAGIAEKGPSLRYVGDPTLDKVGCVSALTLEDSLQADYPGIEFEDAPVGIIDQACERTVALKSGGSVTFDQTQALLAVDVDKGSAEKTLDCCLEAAAMIAAQLRLRGLGGLIVLDFPNLRQPKQRTSLMKALERAFADDPAMVKIAPLSRFGVIEMTRSQSAPSLDAQMNTRFGEPTDETLALRALRRLEREGKANGGAKLELFLPQQALTWLETTELDWRGGLDQRIGARYSLTAGDTIDVKADR